MNIIRAIRQKPYHMILGTLGIFLAPVLIALLVPGGLYAWQVTVLEQPGNLAVSILLSVFFGSFLALYAYNRSLPACCTVNASKTGFVGGIGAAFLGKCPACFSALALILPAFGIGSSLSITLFMAQWAWLVMLLAVLLIAHGIYRLEGFSRPARL